jgi:hypothetical protein
VYVDGTFSAAFTANVSRPDVAAAFPSYGALHGFTMLVGVPSGTHTICVYGINNAGTTNPSIGCRVVS